MRHCATFLHFDWPAVVADGAHGLPGLHQGLVAVVVALAEGLEGAGEEGGAVTAVRRVVVGHGGGDDLAIADAHPAKRLACQLLAAPALPLGCAVPRLGDVAIGWGCGHAAGPDTETPAGISRGRNSDYDLR